MTAHSGRGGAPGTLEAAEEDRGDAARATRIPGRGAQTATGDSAERMAATAWNRSEAYFLYAARCAAPGSAARAWRR